eukprot:3365185-Lingulodinium_polyedra.AAC.1
MAMFSGVPRKARVYNCGVQWARLLVVCFLFVGYVAVLCPPFWCGVLQKVQDCLSSGSPIM